MDLLVLLIIIAAAVIVLGGGLFFLRRGDADVLDAPPAAPPVDAPSPTDEVEAAPEPEPEPDVPGEKPRFRDRLGRARDTLSGYLGSVLSRGVDNDTWDELEEALIRADIGVRTSVDVLEAVRAKVDADKVTEGDEVLAILKQELKDRLGGHDLSLSTDVDGDGMPVWLFVGVNGVGKTTTIGKLSRREGFEGRSIVLAAGDTFRAAAAEQLGMWAERTGAGIIRGAEGGDPSSVIFDAVESATAKGADLVMADTAGRLHNKSNLMEELRKVRRVSEKGSGVVTEVLLVIDATTGQNGLEQARVFTEAVDVTGVVLSKLDGSAKGGIVLAIQNELDIPVKLVGLGEGPDDLVEFDADEFVEALFS